MGLQRDGNLWGVAWHALAIRSSGNQGHATDEDIAEGRSSLKDKTGNDRGDKLADKGVEIINGTGLIRLGKWLAARHDKYTWLIPRLQRVIVAVTLAEKEKKT